jgi:hypothetical protein
MSPFNTSFVSPIPELQRNDGDLKVNIVGFNRKAYSKPVEDPFFKAHTRITEFANATADEPYISDFPAGALGCLLQVSIKRVPAHDEQLTDALQYQFCYARDSKDRVCTGLSGLSSEVTQAVFPDANELQLAVLRLIMSSNYAFDHTFTGEALLAGSIKAKTNETLPELPDDQWIKELVWAESKVWAALQVSIADYAIGPTVRDRGVGLNEFIAPVTSGEKQLCGLQKMKHSGDFA